MVRRIGQGLAAGNLVVKLRLLQRVLSRVPDRCAKKAAEGLFFVEAITSAVLGKKVQNKPVGFGMK